MPGKVLIAFRDESLGGTSRSAISSGRVWRSLGFACLYSSDAGVDPRRLAVLRELGEFVASDQLTSLEDVEFVHLHQAAWTGSSQHLFQTLLETARCAVGPVPTLVVNNIFGSDIPQVHQWPGQVVVTVLGRWSAWQMAGEATWFPRARAETQPVLPNPQDDEFFRAPSADERRASRLSLGLDDDRPIVTRVGSPSDDKWSDSYLELAERTHIGGGRLVLVGAPPGLADRLSGVDGVQLLDLISDEDALRQLYWATDVFALDAQRGESFGNVILESLLCGARVVYRARPFRDNTPFEFTGLPGFHYAGNRVAWIETTLAQMRTPDPGDAHAAAARTRQYTRARERYGVTAVAHQLQALTTESSDPVRATIEAEFRMALTTGDIIRLRVRHNPVAARIRRRRRRRW